MKSETKQCQNCKQNFLIEPDDFLFYEKVKVPPPTWCPECRMVRRMAFRNERALYRRTCDLCRKDIIAIYPSDTRFKVYCPPCYYSDGWDPFDYGRDYNFSLPFFEQFRELQYVVPRMALMQENVVNSPYTNFVRNAKNCYLEVGSEEVQDEAYSTFALFSKDCFDSYWILNSELVYGSIESDKCFRAFFSFRCFDSHDVWFSYDCSGCSNLVGCMNLRNKSYQIFNQPVSKDEYHAFVEEYFSGSYRKLIEFSEKAVKFITEMPQRNAFSYHSINCTGEFIESSRNCENCWHVDTIQDSKNLSIVLNTNDTHDVHGGINNELVYEGVSLAESENVRFSCFMWRGCHDMEYCNHIYGGNKCFGSIGFKKNSYCILNKQYTKEEYEKLVPKIIEHMNSMPYKDKQGRVYKYGEFFPPELSLFAYNETIAQEYFPLTKDEALRSGYAWKDPEKKNYTVTLKAENIPDHIRDISDSILKETVGCAHEGKCNQQCTTAFKIIPQELEFYRKMNLPLPRLCPNCRHYERLKQRNPLKLWHRKCTCAGEKSENGVYQNQTAHFHGKDHCPNEFETSYAPERAEIVYCEQCYQNEVI